MAYKVLSLKWRPQSFKDVVGQDHLVKTLVNAFKQDRIAQGYIFTGPRGVGKTTTARIMAMALNADNGSQVDFNPKSTTSLEIAEGRSMDVLEIDGASNRGIEEIRGLREQIKFSPISGSFKVIIIDEVHMLTNQAFNALLRTLEEPPSHVKFIFATTDIHKVPATIISRCQRFDFNRISISVISGRVQVILEAEKIKSDPESIHAIAKKADGSMRDALSLLDQAISYCGGELKYESTAKVLGLIELDLYFDFTTFISNKNYNGMINLLNRFSSCGIPAPEVMIGIEEHIRNLIYAGVDNGIKLLEMNVEQKDRYKNESAKWDRRDLFRICQVLIDTSSVIRRSEDPYLLLEMTSLKLLEMDKSVLIDELLSFDSSSNRKEKNVEAEEPIKNKSFDKIEPDKSKAENSNQKEIDRDLDQKKDIDENTKQNEIIDLDKVKKLWPNIIEGINKLRPSVGSIIEDFHPVALNDKIVTLKQIKDFEFNEEIIQRGRSIIDQEFSRVLGDSFKLNFIKFDKPKSDDKVIKNTKEIDQNDEKVFNKVVDLFDGEIL